MSYPYPQDPYNGQGRPPQLPVNAAYGEQYAQYPAPRPVVNDSPHLNGNIYQKKNGPTDTTQSPVNGAFQHRQAVPSQQTPQRAYAVAIPALQALSNPSNDYHGIPNLQQPAASVHSLSSSSHPSNGYHTKGDTPQSAPSAPPLDYQILLLSMAEEYFAAAYGRGSMADMVRRETEVQEYYKLIATGLGCLEAVLKHFKLQPESEAIVRLRYATVLYEETENTMEAEEALSKGISICDRHRFFDLKYDMQHLLTRILFQKNKRAAFKFIDGIMKDAEAYQHIAWVYAFRFLKVSLHLELSSHQDLLFALTQLRSIITLSDGYGDKTILAIATTLEALTCLKVSSNAESIEQAQRALAGVRSLQLDPAIGELHQLTVLISFADLCCHLQHFDPVQAMSKLQIMQTALKIVEESHAWTADGSFAIPIPAARLLYCKTRSGIIREKDDGSLVLMFNWMPKEDIYTVGYLLSGVAMAHRNTTDGQKAEHMLEEGIRRLDCNYPFMILFDLTDMLPGANRENGNIPKSITLASSQQTWREHITCYMRLHLAFTLCARTSWSAANTQQSELMELLLPMSHVPEPLLLLTAYLEGVIYQGSGILGEAVESFSSERLSIDRYRKTMHPSHMHLDISLLSALNTLMIIRSPNHPLHHTASTILARIEHLCLRNSNLQIQAAYHLVAATTSSASTILLTKQSLQSALQSAKQSDNKQIMCIVLNFMSWKFFRGVVGEQAEKSARASQTLAQKCMDGLWMSVSAGVLGDTLEAAGRIEEAKSAREGGAITADNLPERVLEAMRREKELDGNVAMTDEGEQYEKNRRSHG